jgi:uncharacterized protein (TIGR02246 family)
MRVRRFIVLAVALLAALACGVSAVPGTDPPAPPAPKAGAGKARQADLQAIRRISRDLLRALEKGDARAVAAFWTDEGEYVGPDGATVRGRAAIQAAYAKFLAANPKLKAEGHIDSIHFLSRDSAVEEGYLRITGGKAGQPVASRYSILYVREDGRWQMALVRDWPEEGATLMDLDWLIGTWVAKTDGVEVRTTYSWDEGKKFIRVRFSIKEKEGTVAGTQVIGRDPRTGQLRSWLFEDDGGFGDAAWSRDGKRWVLEATGVQADGSELTATNILTPLDRDSFTWQSIDRTLDGEQQPNIPPVKVRRVK